MRALVQGKAIVGIGAGEYANGLDGLEVNFSGVNTRVVANGGIPRAVFHVFGPTKP